MAAKVWMLVAAEKLDDSMSRYSHRSHRRAAEYRSVDADRSERLEGTDGMLETVRWR
jgi:hypothetical protein